MVLDKTDITLEESNSGLKLVFRDKGNAVLSIGDEEPLFHDLTKYFEDVGFVNSADYNYFYCSRQQRFLPLVHKILNN